MVKQIYDVIIIGSGPAGMTASIYCSRKGLKTLIIGKEIGGQVVKTGTVENYLGFGMSTGTDLARIFEEHTKKFANIEHIHDILVKEIVKKNKHFVVKTENKKTFEAKSLIIASGRNPRQLNIPGEKEYKNRGVTYCEICDAPLFKGKNVAVIGGGNSGLQAVMALANICPQVYLLEYGAELKGDKVLQDKIKPMKNVKIITNAQTLAISGGKFVKGIKYKDLKTKKETTLKVEGIFIEIGWLPAIDFDKVTKKNKATEIIVDKQCRTNIPGIFAAGDITDVGYWQIIIAAGEGAKAALSAYEFLSKIK